MLPRGEMLKVDKVDSFFAANDRFTPVQELKQVGVFCPKLSDVFCFHTWPLNPITTCKFQDV